MHGNDLLKICIMSTFVWHELLYLSDCHWGEISECRFEPFSVVTLRTWVHDWHPSMNVQAE
jgi:hypothetical protein